MVAGPAVQVVLAIEVKEGGIKPQTRLAVWCVQSVAAVLQAVCQERAKLEHEMKKPSNEVSHGHIAHFQDAYSTPLSARARMHAHAHVCRQQGSCACLDVDATPEAFDQRITASFALTKAMRMCSTCICTNAVHVCSPAALPGLVSQMSMECCPARLQRSPSSAVMIVHEINLGRSVRSGHRSDRRQLSPWSVCVCHAVESAYVPRSAAAQVPAA